MVSNGRLSANACVVPYIHRTYKCQNGREDATLKGRVLWSYNEGLPGEEIGLGDGTFSVRNEDVLLQPERADSRMIDLGKTYRP